MSIVFRQATREDVVAAVDLLRDDGLGSVREIGSKETYLAAFEAMQSSHDNLLIVGELNREIAATYQIVLIPGISLKGALRAQLEGVRVASHLRGQGFGHLLIADAKSRAVAKGASLIQLTMNQSRSAAKRFYEGVGFEASHTGFKMTL